MVFVIGAGNHTEAPLTTGAEKGSLASAFTINKLSRPNFHVCGEVTLITQGFIEGSLRSSAYVLHHIDKHFMSLLWKDLGSENKDYFKDLEGWVNRLDTARQ